MNDNNSVFDEVMPISVFKINLNSVLRKFRLKQYTRVMITRNGKPVIEIVPLAD